MGKILMIRCVLDFRNLQLHISKIPGAKEKIRIWGIAQNQQVSPCGM